MANSLYENVFTVDTAASILFKYPVWVKKIVLEPNAAGDSAVFNFWDEGAAYEEGSGSYLANAAIAGTITSTTTLTMASGTLLPSAVRDGDVFHILSSDGSTANVGTKSVVTTAGNNTVIVATNAGWTNEASKYYRFKTYPYRPAAKLMTPTTDVVEVQLDFGENGQRFPNLIIETLSTSAVCRVYIK